MTSSKLTAALTIALLTTAASASAQTPSAGTTTAPAPNADAQAHFQRALELHQEQDFAGALVEFRRAQELAPSYKMLYNIGQVCFQLTDYACALRNFEQYLREGGSQVASDRRAEVEKELQKLRLRVGRVEVVSNLPGVEVAVDDVVIGKTPLGGAVVVSSGKRRITGTHEGYAPVTRAVEVAGNDALRVELAFVSATTGEAAPATPARRESRWNTVSWIGLGAAAAFGAAAGVTGAIALGADRDLDDERFADGPGPSAGTLDTRDRARTFSVLSDVFLGASVVTLAGTLIYTFVHHPKTVEVARPAAKKIDLKLGVTGAALTGSF